MKYYTLLLCFLLVNITGNTQQSGQFDPAFGDEGITKLEFQPLLQNFPKIAQQKDGSIVSYVSLGIISLNVYRFLPNGNLDSSFGENGSLVITPGFQGVSAIGLLKDNSIVVAGATSFSKEILMRRFSPYGQIDSTFGVNGLARTTFGGELQSVRDILITKDDKIVTVGTFSEYGDRYEILVARFNNNGSLDSSFGEEMGKTRIDRVSYSQKINLQKDGGIVVGGSDRGLGPSSRFMLCRLSPNGKVDSSFGNNGISLIDFDTDGDLINNISIQPDDKIVAVGVARIDNLKNQEPYMAIARYMPNGALDSRFGDEGKVKLKFDDYAEAYGVGIQNNGKIVVSGYVSKLAGNAVLARLNSTGSLDSSFGENGITISDFGTGQDQGYDLVIQPSGRIVVRCTPGLILAGYTNEDKVGFITKIKRWIRSHILNFTDANGTATQYNIEQQNSGGGFATIASLLPNKNNSYSYNISNYTSATVNSNFRIKAVYADGSTVYSEVVTQAALQADTKVSISPNPASSIIHIAMKENAMQDGTVYIYDAMGKQVKTQSFAKQTEISINISSLQQGHYRVVVNSNGIISESNFLKE